jgi:hypothetical protein
MKAVTDTFKFVFLITNKQNAQEKLPKFVMVVIVWYLYLQLPMQSVPITTNVVSSNPTQAGCTCHDITEILLKVALFNTSFTIISAMLWHS